MTTQGIYSKNNVNITSTLAIINNVSYPINGVTAVFVNRKSLSIGAIILGSILALIGLAGMGGNFIVGLIFLIIGAVFIVSAFNRPHYLILRTSGGDTQALESTDLIFINEVRAAIEVAVTSRG